MKKIRFPTLRIPGLFPAINLALPFGLPLPKHLKIGGTKAALTTLLFIVAGFVATIWVTVAGTTHEIIWPTAGAEYNLPSEVGTRLAPDDISPMTASQTLRINLASGVRLDKLHLKNLDLGKAGLDRSFYVTGVTGSHVDVGLITIRNSSAPTLDWSRINAGCIQLAGEMDGRTNNITVDSTVPNLVIDSDRGSGSYVAENSQVDRIILTTNSGVATIGEILIDDVDSSVGAWSWEHINAGCIVMEANNKFGNNTGINQSSAIFNDTVKSRSVTDNILEVPTSIK